MSKMKAWTISKVVAENGSESGSIRFEELEKPVCGDDQVILKVDCASVCGGDINTIRAGGFEEHCIIDGGEFGHELGGTIVEKGKDVTDLEIGDRVWPYPVLCSDPIGVRAGCLGGFSEYVRIDKAKENYNLFKLSDKVSDLEAALIEPLTIGWHAGRQAHPAAGKNAVVFGAGFIAIAAAICLQWNGCDKVAIVGRRREKLKVCEELGFKTFTTLDADWKQQLTDYFGRGYAYSPQAINAQCFVEAAGSDDIVDEIIPLMNMGARMAIVAVHPNPVTFHSNLLTFGDLEIVGSAGQRPEDAIGVIECIESKRYPLEKLVKIYKQEELETAVQAMIDGKVTKAVIDYTGKYL